MFNIDSVEINELLGRMKYYLSTRLEEKKNLEDKINSCNEHINHLNEVIKYLNSKNDKPLPLDDPFFTDPNFMWPVAEHEEE